MSADLENPCFGGRLYGMNRREKTAANSFFSLVETNIDNVSSVLVRVLSIVLVCTGIVASPVIEDKKKNYEPCSDDKADDDLEEH